jgi:hypothetical protein
VERWSVDDCECPPIASGEQTTIMAAASPKSSTSHADYHVHRSSAQRTSTTP